MAILTLEDALSSLAVAFNSTPSGLVFHGILRERLDRGRRLLLARADRMVGVIYSGLLGRSLGLCYKLPAEGKPEEYAGYGPAGVGVAIDPGASPVRNRAGGGEPNAV
ncbi:MAG: hypothetical protein WAR24_24740, partial [Candidatus Acidiferrales bacterium]